MKFPNPDQFYRLTLKIDCRCAGENLLKKQCLVYRFTFFTLRDDRRQWRLVNHKQNCKGIYSAGCTQLWSSASDQIIKQHWRHRVTPLYYILCSTFRALAWINTLLSAIGTTGVNTGSIPNGSRSLEPVAAAQTSPRLFLLTTSLALTALPACTMTFSLRN